MRIQPITNMNASCFDFGKKSKKVNNLEKNINTDAIHEMNKDFTRAAIIAILIEICMITAAYLKNHKKDDPNKSKTEMMVPDVFGAEQNDIWYYRED